MQSWLKPDKNYSLSSRRNIKTGTEDDIDILLDLADLYNTIMILKQQNGFGGNIREVVSFEELDTSILGEAKGAELFEVYTSKFELAEILIEYEFLDENLF